MGKFGKRNIVSESLTDYSVCILGLSGIGKTTLMVNTCRRLVGDDGYIILNMGKEDGISCINGAMYENVENWKKLDEVVKDIVKNKNTDYPDLKIVVIDTIDQMFEIAEPEVIRRYNVEKRGELKFTPVTSINAAYGGYGSGLEQCCKLVLDTIWALKKAGVTVWMTGHTKTKDIPDPLTDQTYTTISANLSQKYFNAIKTKVHIVGMAVIDRDIITEGVGRKDIHNKEITRNKIKSEARKIVFRDDNYGVDSKSRFRYIVDEIPLDADALIKAMQDAIYQARNEDAGVVEPIIKSAPRPVVETPQEEAPIEEVEQDDDDFLNEDATEEEPTIEDLRLQIREAMKTATTEQKAEVRKIATEYGNINKADKEGLEKILEIFG